MTSVHAWNGPVTQLPEMLELLLPSKRWHWMTEPTRSALGEGMPQEIWREGQVFSAKREVRWNRVDDTVRLLLIADDDESPSGMVPVEGNWTSRRLTIQLADLTERRFRASVRYPTSTPTDGLLEVALVESSEGTSLVSPRVFLDGGRS